MNYPTGLVRILSVLFLVLGVATIVVAIPAVIYSVQNLTHPEWMEGIEGASVASVGWSYAVSLSHYIFLAAFLFQLSRLFRGLRSPQTSLRKALGHGKMLVIWCWLFAGVQIVDIALLGVPSLSMTPSEATGRVLLIVFVLILSAIFYYQSRVVRLTVDLQEETALTV